MNNNSPSMVTVLVSALAFLAIAYFGYSFVIAPYRTNALKISGL